MIVGLHLRHAASTSLLRLFNHHTVPARLVAAVIDDAFTTCARTVLYLSFEVELLCLDRSGSTNWFFKFLHYDLL